MCKSAWPTQDPHMIFIIDCDIRTESHSPLCRNFRKIRIELELWQSPFTDMRRLHRCRLFGDLWGPQTRNRPHHQYPNEDGTSQGVASHGFLSSSKGSTGSFQGSTLSQLKGQRPYICLVVLMAPINRNRMSVAFVTGVLPFENGYAGP